ncbi:hypothetical protein [Spiroplasma endosymbiont of Villa modesta]|uniref:hypothetical protein n=1 Tax=Spiroplasma endosymbiont of Villa modesta TaxID=3066293 RepID=UPI00313B6D57
MDNEILTKSDYLQNKYKKQTTDANKIEMSNFSKEKINDLEISDDDEVLFKNSRLVLNNYSISLEEINETQSNNNKYCPISCTIL